MQEVEFFLIHLELSQADTLFEDLLLASINLELLNPKELGSKWQNIHFVKDQSNQNNPEFILKLRQIDRVISKYSNQYSFEQNQESGDIAKVLENWQEKHLLDAVQRLNSNSIIDKKFLQQKSILKKQKNHWQVTIIRDLKALYTKYEILAKLSNIRSKLFTTDKNSSVHFACFAVPQKDSQKVIKILAENKIDYEQISWTTQFKNPEQSKELFYNIPTLAVNPILSKFFIFVYYLLCSIVLHDVFAGLVIVTVSLLAYRYNLKSKSFLNQVWIGLGAIILGIISGSFGGNMLQVLSMSKYLVVKEVSTALLSFISLFQIVDWTNQSPNLLLNSILLAQSNAPLGFLVSCYTLVAITIMIIVQFYKAIQSYRLGILKLVIVRCVFVLTIGAFVLYFANFLPLWPSFVLLVGLYLYQPPLQFLSKFKTLFLGEFGFFGFLQLFLNSLWFGAVFGVLICSSLLYNSFNNAIGDNVFVMVFANLLISLLMWQVMAFIVAKAFRANINEQLEVNLDINTDRNLEPIIKYKYWKV